MKNNKWDSNADSPWQSRLDYKHFTLLSGLQFGNLKVVRRGKNVGFKNERLKNHGKEATCKNWQTRKGDCGGIHIQGINETMGDRCAGSRRAMTLKGDNWWTEKE